MRSQRGVVRGGGSPWVSLGATSAQSGVGSFEGTDVYNKSW
jgi:hypothetical protein